MKSIKFTSYLLTITLSLFVFASCDNDQAASDLKSSKAVPSKVSVAPDEYCGESKVVDLLAGQYIVSGSVIVGNDEENLYVTYTTTDGWLLKHVHLYVGDCAGIPLNNGGNPQIGQFPVNVAQDPYSTSATFSFPLSSLNECVCIAAHAEVVKLDGNGTIIAGETAWGDGDDIGGGSWATKFGYCVQECDDTEIEEEEPCYEEDTAWAAGQRYVTKGNWATYTAFVPGTVNIYAGQTKLAGTATLSPAVNGEVTITIDLGEGWSLQEGGETVKIQPYASAPKGNPAPGLFTYKGTLLEITVPEANFYGIHMDVRKEVTCIE